MMQAFAFLHAHVVSHDLLASHLAHHITITVAKAFTAHFFGFMDYLLEMVF
jgi:hypothetical protein